MSFVDKWMLIGLLVLLCSWLVGRLVGGKDFKLIETAEIIYPKKSPYLKDNHDQSVVMTRVMDDQRSNW